MKIVLIIFTSLIIVSLQLTVLARLGLFNVAPNLILALSIAWAIYQKDQKHSWLILIPAVLFDLLIGRPLGLITLAIWLTFSFVSWLGKFLFKQSGFIPVMVLSLSGVVFYELIYAGLIRSAQFFNLNGAKILWTDFYLFAPRAILYNCILCLIAFWLIKKALPAFNKLK